MVRYYDGADGLKTGHTDNAGYCLAVTAKRDGLRLIAIVLGESDNKVRNSEAMSLLDYGFNSINLDILKKKGTNMKNIIIDKANVENFGAVLENDLGVVTDINNKNRKYNYDISIDNIKLPLKKGTKIGTIDVYYKDNKVTDGNLVSDREVLPLSYFELLYNGFKDIISGNI